MLSELAEQEELGVRILSVQLLILLEATTRQAGQHKSESTSKSNQCVTPF